MLLQVWDCLHLTSHPGAAHKGMFGLYQSTRRTDWKHMTKLFFSSPLIGNSVTAQGFWKFWAEGNEWKKMKQVDLPTLSLYGALPVQNIDQVAGTVSAPLRSIPETDDKDTEKRNTSSELDFWKSWSGNWQPFWLHRLGGRRGIELHLASGPCASVKARPWNLIFTSS